jgi:hypothetical protein
VLAVAAAAVIGLKARTDAALRFLGLTSLTTAVAFVAVSRTTGLPYNYLFNWLRPASAFLWAAVAWTLFSAWRSSAPDRVLIRPDARVAVVVGTALATAALSVSALTNGVGLDFQEANTSDRVAQLLPGTLTAVAGEPRVYLRQIGGWCAGELGNGLALQLVEHGTDVAVVEPLAPAYGRHRIRHDVVPTVELLCGPVAKDAIGRLPIRPVAQSNILTDAELAELEGLQAGFRERLVAAGRSELVPAVDGHLFPALVREKLADLHFDPAAVARFDVLMGRSENSAAVFYRPFGPNQPP